MAFIGSMAVLRMLLVLLWLSRFNCHQSLSRCATPQIKRSHNALCTTRRTRCLLFHSVCRWRKMHLLWSEAIFERFDQHCIRSCSELAGLRCVSLTYGFSCVFFT